MARQGDRTVLAAAPAAKFIGELGIMRKSVGEHVIQGPSVSTSRPGYLGADEGAPLVHTWP